MTLKTFNLDREVYEEFSKHCKKHGISMSKKVENFIKREVKNIKMKKSDLGDFRLEIDKDVKDAKPHPPSPSDSHDDSHPMGRYC